MTPNVNIQSTEPKRRNCYFNDEKPLKAHNSYSQVSQYRLALYQHSFSDILILRKSPILPISYIILKIDSKAIHFDYSLLLLSTNLSRLVACSSAAFCTPCPPSQPTAAASRGTTRPWIQRPGYATRLNSGNSMTSWKIYLTTSVR